MEELKHSKLACVLLSCLLAVSNGAVMSAFAAEDTMPETEPAALTAGEAPVAEETAETTTIEEETTAEEVTEAAEVTEAPVEEPETATEAETAPAVQEIAEAPLVQAVDNGILSVTLSLSSDPDAKNGMVHEANGNVCYVNEGRKLVGHFSVTPDYLKGDLGGDGNVDASDAACILIASSTAGTSMETAGELLADAYDSVSDAFQATQIADINNDGDINASDAAEVLIYASRCGAGEEVKPLGCAQYYADENGVLQTGWINDDADKLHANNDYTLSEGWTTVDGATYYFSEDAKMQTGYVQLADRTYHLGQDGAMTTGWLDTNDGVFYFDVTTGSQAFGVQVIDGYAYYFDEKGALGYGGWLNCTDGKRYADKNGVLATDWQTIDGSKYYFNGNGVLATGETTIGAKTYLFDKNGVPVTGLKDSDSGKRYYKEDGEMAVGFVELEDGTHYFNSIGLMAVGWAEYQANKYYFDKDGVMATGNIVMDGIKYHFEDDGIYNPIKICLDAGHYGKYNHSPVVDTYWESDFTWRMHLHLKAALEAKGIEVITTRADKDVDMGLAPRGEVSKGCDLFLSIHSNACGDPSVDAPLACCAINGSADKLGQMMADLVAEVMETNQGGTIWKRHGIKEPDFDYYSVLRGATNVGTPAILLEHSYHTNYRATMWLLNDDNCKRMAEAEAELLADYFGMND